MSDKGLRVHLGPLGELVQAGLFALIILDQQHVPSVVKIDDIAQTVVDALRGPTRCHDGHSAARRQHCHSLTVDHPVAQPPIGQLLHLELVALLEGLHLLYQSQPSPLLLPN